MLLLLEEIDMYQHHTKVVNSEYLHLPNFLSTWEQGMKVAKFAFDAGP